MVTERTEFKYLHEDNPPTLNNEQFAPTEPSSQAMVPIDTNKIFNQMFRFSKIEAVCKIAKDLVTCLEADLQGKPTTRQRLIMDNIEEIAFQARTLREAIEAALLTPQGEYMGDLINKLWMTSEDTEKFVQQINQQNSKMEVAYPGSGPIKIDMSSIPDEDPPF